MIKYRKIEYAMSPMPRQPLTIEHALLGFVREQPMHAYEIHQTMLRPDVLGRVWHLKQSLAYVMLERLEQAGYLAVQLEQQQARPPRKLLHLTEQGRTAFAHWLTEPVLHGREFRLEFLLKLYFAKQGPQAQLQALVSQQREACVARIAALQREMQYVAGDSYEMMVLQFRIGQLQAMLEWLEQSVTAVVE
jgi:PadR family transcriptional regulator AphA